MKFGESLSDGLVPEWKDQYLNYKQGKKLIKKLTQLKNDIEIEDSQENPDDLIDYYAGEQSHELLQLNGKRLANEGTPLLTPSDEDPQKGKGRNDETWSHINLADSSNSDSNDQNASSSSHNKHMVHPIESDSNSDHGNDQGNQKQNSTRRQSIFNYSLKSSKDKKESFYTEKKKFFNWLDSELGKVDHFYREKENEIYERFLILQDQLYQLRDHKAAVMRAKAAHFSTNNPSHFHNNDPYYKVNDIAYHTRSVFEELRKYDLPSLPSTKFLKKWKKNHTASKDTVLTKYKNEDDEFDPNFTENQIRNGVLASAREDDELLDSEVEDQSSTDNIRVSNAPQTPALQRKTRKRDYEKQKFGVPYAYAKKQLKGAIIEHYRYLSLIKSYKTLNRTAFRKITKKFDKAIGSSISGDFMKRVDNDSLFQTSELIDKLISFTEELYMSFFDPEADSRKHGLDKLKSSAYAYNNSDIRQPSYYASFFVSGISLGFAIPLIILGLYQAVSKTLNGQLPEGQYLLQVWGGFFLLNLDFILFGVNLYVFEKFRINYKFIFEFNTSNTLDYKQFFLIPSIAFALLGLLFWFSFNNFFPHRFPGRDWPWLYVGIVLIIFLWPGKQFFGPSRRWLQIALWRLLLSGFYPVEFRDFFLGDVFSSLTYTMGNISFFFCLYAHHWNGILNGSKTELVCGSSRSRLMGFFSSLPSIWRILQCVRRFSDTGDWFPHLANLLKYAITALYYCLLSVWRIERTSKHRIVFIIFATINSLYTATWDIVMDWSLLQPGSKNYLLRDNLFFKRPFFYYAAIITDIVLRFQWIFYAFFSGQIQQLAVTSFCIAVAELFRRFVWIFFRMENEHCTNVTLFRASKDSPLPYSISSSVERAIKKLVNLKYKEANPISAGKNDEDLTISRPPTGQMSRYSKASGVSAHPSHVTFGDEEADLGLSDITQNAELSNIERISNKLPSAVPKLTRRKSTIMNISDVLNKAHIKDFQRKKKPVIEENDDSDDEDEDDVDEHSRHASINTPAGVPAGTNY